MANRKSYWVQYLANHWAVRHNGVTLSTHVTKDEATAAGVKVAKANAPSELFICNKNGQIEDRMATIPSRRWAERLTNPETACASAEAVSRVSGHSA